VFTADTVAILNDAATATALALTVPINPLLTTVSIALPIDPALLKLSSQKTVNRIFQFILQFFINILDNELS